MSEGSAEVRGPVQLRGLDDGVGTSAELPHDHLDAPAERDADQRPDERAQPAGDPAAQRGADEHGEEHPEGVRAAPSCS